MFLIRPDHFTLEGGGGGGGLTLKKKSLLQALVGRNVFTFGGAEL